MTIHELPARLGIEHSDGTQPRVHVIDPRDGKEFEEWLSLRRRFMLAKGWLNYAPGEDDRDAYDALDSTSHIVASMPRDDGVEGVVAGLRLTPVDSVHDLKSFSMLSEQAQSRMREEDFPGIPTPSTLLDMTRFVATSRRQGYPEYDIESILAQLLGAAVAESERFAEPDKELVWVFCVDKDFLDFLISKGVNVEVVLEDEGAGKTILAYVKPRELLMSASVQADKFGQIALQQCLDFNRDFREPM